MSAPKVNLVILSLDQEKRPSPEKAPPEEMVKKIRTRKTVKEEHKEIASDILDSMALDFDCGVAVWLTGLRTMSNEIIGFVDHSATEYGSVSKCPKFRLKTDQFGTIYLFKTSNQALEFCGFLNGAKSPHGDYGFLVEHLGAYLRIAAEIEDSVPDVHQTAGTKLIIRNLETSRKVLTQVLDFCRVFGNYLRYDEYRDVGELFDFRHLVITYKFAVQAFAAKLGLDGKWIKEQVYPLSVEVDLDAKVKYINMELLKRNKTLFQF